MTCFIDFGSQNRPQIHAEITKKPFPNPSRNRTRKITENLQKQTQPNLENRAPVRAWCWFSLFHAFQKKQEKMSKYLLKVVSKPLKNNNKKTINKHTPKNTLKTSPFYSKIDPIIELKKEVFRQHRLPGPPRAPNASKDDPRTPKSPKK